MTISFGLTTPFPCEDVTKSISPSIAFNFIRKRLVPSSLISVGGIVSNSISLSKYPVA